MADPTIGRRRTNAAKAAETPELRRLRHRIDALDRRIVALLNERAELARDVGRAKTRAGAARSATPNGSARSCCG